MPCLIYLTMCRYLGSLVLCIALLFPAVLSAEKFGVDFDPSYDFSGLKRYQWKTHPKMEADPALAERAIAGDIVMSEGNEILMGRGYVPDDFTPQFYMTFFVEGRLENNPITVGSSWYYGPGTAWASYETFNRQYVDGTLVIDIVDAESEQLVWRAYYSDKITNWKGRDKKISKAVKKALKKFPPKPAK